MLLVSQWTFRRRIVEYGLEEITGFSMISDAQLDNLVERFMTDHGTLVGYSLVSGHLRSLGLRVQRDRIRESIGRVDPGNYRLNVVAPEKTILPTQMSRSMKIPSVECCGTEFWSLSSGHFQQRRHFLQ